jgi:hypothetical protein
MKRILVSSLAVAVLFVFTASLRAEEAKKEAKSGEWTGTIEKDKDGVLSLKVKDASYKLVAGEKAEDVKNQLEKLAKEAKGEYVVKGTLSDDGKSITVEKIHAAGKKEGHEHKTEGK